MATRGAASPSSRDGTAASAVVLGGIGEVRRSPRSVGQAEDALRDDVELDLGGAALDGVAAGAEPVACQADFAVVEAGSFPAEGLWAGDLHRELAPALVQLGAVELEERGLGAGFVAGLHAVARARHGE